MTTLTEESPATPTPPVVAQNDSQDQADPVTGLTLADEQVILTAQAEVFRVCTAAAARILAARLPAAEQQVKDAETALGEARAALEGPQAVTDHLNGELAECSRRAEEAHLAAEDESLDARIEARVAKRALEEEVSALRERVQIAVRITDPLIVAVAAAERELRTARGRLAELQKAVAFPFTEPAGKATVPYVQYLVATGLWLGSDSSDSRAIVREALRITGMGAEIERNAIGAFVSGDPTARSIGTSVKNWPDGTSLIHTPGTPPIVTHGRATPEGLSSAPAIPQGHGPGAAEVISGVRNGFGWPDS